MFLEVFLKNKKRPEKSPPYLVYCMIFEEIYFSRHILLTDQVSLADYLKDSFKKRRHIKNFQTLFQKYSSGGVPWKSFF